MQLGASQRLYVHRWGQPEGPPVLLLHGLGESHRVWRSTANRLGERYAFFSPDLPGYGKSPMGKVRLDNGCIPLEENADRIARWLNRSGLSPLPVVGHSMGGLIAVDLARRYPEYVKQLILVAPAGLHRSEWDAALQSAPPVWWLRRLLLWWMSTNWMGPRYFSGTVYDWRVIGKSERADLRWGWRKARALERARQYYHVDFVGWISEIRQPISMIWGLEDRVVPAADAGVLQAARPDARVEFMDRCGHLPMLERPKRFSQLLDRELSTTGEIR